MSEFSLEQAYTPGAAAPPSPAPKSFSLDEAYGASKADVTPPAETPKPKGFWGTLTEGGWEGFLRDTLPSQVADRAKDVREAKAQLQKDDTAERDRRTKAGESLNGMENWRLNRLNEIIASKKPQAPTPSFGEVWNGIKKAAIADPAGMAGQVARGFITHPELLATPELLPERIAASALTLGKTASTVAKVGTEAVQIGAATGAESALEQLNKTGKVNPAQTGMDVAMTAAPIVGARFLLPKQKAQVTLAADLAVSKGVEAGAERSGELVRQVVEDTQAKVAQGVPVYAALKDSLESAKVSPEAAEDAASLFKSQEMEHAQRNESGQVLPEAQGKEGEVKRGGNLSVIDEAKSAHGQEPQGEEPREGSLDNLADELRKVSRGEPVPAKPVVEAPKAQPETNVIRPQAFKPLPEGVPKRFATPEEARSIYQMAGIDPEAAAKMADKPIAMGALRQRLSTFMGGQKYADSVLIDAAREGKFGNLESGKVDPTLLKVLGLSAGAGAVYALYTEDPKDAIIGALATGGAIAALAVLRKGLGAVSAAVKDTRYNPKHLTEEYKATIASAQLAHTRLAAQLKALVRDKKQREQLTMYLQGDTSVPLTPEMAVAAKIAKEFFEVWGDKGLKAGVLESFRDNYVTQLWTGLNKNSSLFRNLMQSLGQRNTFTAGMSPKSRFGIERVIPSYKEGMAKGLIPSTLDIADIMKIYGDNMATAIANKNFIAALKRDRMPSGERILGSAEDLKKDIAAGMAKTGQQWKGEGPIVDDIRRFAANKVKDDYVLMQHPSLIGQVAHKDVAPVLNALFDAHTPTAAGKLAYGVAVAAKRAIFSFSFFHIKSLAEAALGAPFKTWTNLFEANKLLKQGAAGDVLDRLVRGGLNVTERPLEGDVTPFSHALQLINEKHPIIGAPVKGVIMVQKAMDHLLWDMIQPTFKVAAGMASMEKLLAKGLSQEAAARGAASFSNDLFGGVDWFRMADAVQNKFGRDLALAVTAPHGRRWLQVLALAPDWTVATARTFAKAIPGITSKEVAALHQGYIFKQAMVYLTVMNGVNQYFSGHNIWENEDPTMIDLGNGQKMQASKHMMEPIHWLMSPGQQALNKLGYVVKEPLEQAMNKQYLSTKGAPPITNAKDTALSGAGKRVEHALSTTLPISGQQLMQSGAIPAISGFFGSPIYGKTDKQYVDAAVEQAKEQGKDEEKAAERARKRRERAKAKAEEARRVSP